MNLLRHSYKPARRDHIQTNLDGHWIRVTDHFAEAKFKITRGTGKEHTIKCHTPEAQERYVSHFNFIRQVERMEEEFIIN